MSRKHKPIVYIESKDLARDALALWVSRSYNTLLPIFCVAIALHYGNGWMILVAMLPFAIPLQYDRRRGELYL